MVEHRDKTSTEGRGLGHSWADDNVGRGDPDVDFIKRRPNFPFGDNPRGRDIDFEDTTGTESYGSTKNQVFRAYRGKPPIEGQIFGMPQKKGKIFQNVKDLQSELPNRSTADVANAALQAGQAGILNATNFEALLPAPTISSPSPGATFSPGDEITIVAPTSALRDLHSATLEIDGQAVDRRVLDRRDQDSTTLFDFRFIYPIPSTQALGPLTITVRAFNMESSMRGIILDDALNTTDRQGGLGTLDGRPGSATSAADYQKLLNQTGFLRSPEGVVSITVNIV
jgi:hypothetical protein